MANPATKLDDIFVVITGLPGTGKTTLAEALAAAIDADHLDTDIIRAALGKRGQYDPETKELVYDDMLRRAETLLLAGKNVVIDGTFYRHDLRDRFQRLAERCGRDIRWVELRADEETIRRRVSRERPHSEADYEVYQKIKAIYEPMNRAHLVLWSDQLSPAEMVERVKDFLMLPA